MKKTQRVTAGFDMEGDYKPRNAKQSLEFEKIRK